MDSEMIHCITKEIMNSISSDKNNKILGLKQAKPMLESGENCAKSMKLNVVLAILDEGGNLIAQHRMDQSLLASIELSRKKAYTSVALQLSTDQLSSKIQPGKPLYGLQNASSTGEYCVFGGGIPLFYNSICIGAVGVSGGTVEQDSVIAKEMERCFYSLEKSQF